MIRSRLEGGVARQRLPAGLERVRDWSATMLLVAAAGLLVAVGYTMLVAWRLIDEPDMFPPEERPTGFADHVAVAMYFAHFSGPGPGLLLFAAALLVGSRMLAGQAPPASATGSHGVRPATAAPLLAVAGLAAATGLLALVYVAAAALALTSQPRVLMPAALQRSALVVDLTVSLAVLAVLTVLLSWSMPIHRTTDNDVQDSQDEDVVDLAAPPPSQSPSDMPHRSSAEVIDSRQWGRAGPTPPSTPG
jgi:hypothetical protein